MGQEKSTPRVNHPFSQYLTREYMIRFLLVAMLIFVITLLIQGIARYKGARIFEGTIKISMASDLVELISILVPHLLFFMLLYLLIRRFFSHPNMNKIGAKTRFFIFFVIITFIFFIYTYRFFTPQPERPFTVSLNEWRLESSSTSQKIILGDQTINMLPNDHFSFSVQRPVTEIENEKIVVSPYNGNENGTFRMNSIEIETNDDELAEGFGLKIGTLRLGFLVNPINWRGIYKQLQVEIPTIRANFSDIFPSVPRDDFLGGNLTWVVTFNIFDEDTSRNVTLSYDSASGVLIHALITKGQSVMELILVYSDDVTGFTPHGQYSTTTDTSSPTTTNSTSMTISITTTPLVSTLPVSQQNLSDLLFLIFLLIMPLTFVVIVGYHLIKNRTERVLLDEGEDSESSLINADMLDQLPVSEQIIHRYRLATQMLEDMGAPRKDSLTPTEFEFEIQKIFDESVGKDFLVLSKGFKIVKFEKEQHLSSKYLHDLGKKCKNAFERIKKYHEKWMSDLKNQELIKMNDSKNPHLVLKKNPKNGSE